MPPPTTWLPAPVRFDAARLGAPAGLTVGHAEDPEERRADRVAESVMARLSRVGDRTVATEPGRAAPAAASSTAPAVRRLAPAAGAAPVVGREGGMLDAGPSGVITARLGGGSSIPEPLRRSMEGAFGRGFADVRLHTDAPAARLSAQLSARAFTVGRDVFFGAGEYQPETADGRHTLAHELAHTGAPISEATRRLTVHRTIARGSKEIRAARGVTGAVGLAGRKLTGTKDRLDVIGRMVDDYNSSRDPSVMHTMLSTLIVLCENYLKEHGVTDAGPGGRKVSVVQDIIAEARRDLGKMAAQERYLGDARAEGTQSASKPGSTAFTKQTAAAGVLNYAHESAKKGERMDADAMKVKPKLPEYDPKSPSTLADAIRDDLPRIMAKYGLTEAEVAAIRTYTVQDFQYINPAVATDDEWMEKQRPLGNEGLRMNSRQRAAAKEEHQRPFHEEGVTHAGVMMSGLERLPPKKGKLYRGEKLTPAQYEKKIAPGRFVNQAFTSASLVKSTAEGFGLDADKTRLRVVYYMDVINARDVRAMSAHAEQEWLLLPGATFEVVGKPVEEPGKRPGDLGRRIVTVKQIR